MALTLLAACNESTPKIVTTGSSRAFDFETFFALPLHAAVLATGGRLSNFGYETQSLNLYDLQTQVVATDTDSSLFNDIGNCKGLSTLNRRIPSWPWINDAASVKTDNNFAVYLAEKAYLRYFTDYCVGRTSFFNENVRESNTSSSAYSNIYYLQSDNLSITDDTQTVVYNLLLSQTNEKDGVIKLLFNLAQKAGQTDNRFYERLNYTKNSSLNSREFAAMRLLVDKEYSDNQLPDFYHLESYTIKRKPTSANDSDTHYDLIKIRAARLENNDQVLLHANIVAHSTYGTYIVEAKSCAKKGVTSLSNLISGNCPNDATSDSFYLSDSAEYKWFTNQGQERTEEGFEADNVLNLKIFAKELDPVSLHWYNFSSDKLAEVFQTSDPTKIIAD